MDIHDFLEQFVAGDIGHVLAVGLLVAAAVFAGINRLDGFLKNNGKDGLAPDVKFWGAIALCFILPIFAYIYVTVSDNLKPTFGGTLMAIGVAFMAATAGHWLTGGSQTANAMHDASLNPGTPVQISGSNAKVVVHKV